MMRIVSFFLVSALCASGEPGLRVTDAEYLDAPGLSVLLYHNRFHPVFIDEKSSALEIIQHGERIATSGDIRLVPTPEQWDVVPTFERRVADKTQRRLTAYCAYPDFGLHYRVEVTAEADGFRIAVDLDQPLPKVLAGRAGFNLEFLPSAYFGKSYVLDDQYGEVPRHPFGPMVKDAQGNYQPEPLARGTSLTLAPEDPLRRMTIVSDGAPLALYDGRNRAQNGWLVVRTLIPADRTANAVVWHIRPHVIPGWTRPPVIAHSQVGYAPGQQKVAVMELDPRFAAPPTAEVVRVETDGTPRTVFKGPVKPWGDWLRYRYARFDFSAVREPGIYELEYAGQRTAPFRIADNVYRKHVWQASLDTFLPVEMDHVLVREGYRVWHGISHRDDARQAPVNHRHFDGYEQGATTDSPFQPGEHIPGLNQGGWFDAGDFDIRTQTQDRVVTDLAWAVEHFHVLWDQTTVDEAARTVVIHRPDGVPDAIQQIEHGVLQLLGQYHAVGHSIPGIIEPTLEEYTHVGDAASQTDNRIYSAKLGRLDEDGAYSGIPDDRWAFTNRTTALEYLTASALAAASRVLQPYNAAMAEECLQTAERVWDEEHRRPPTQFGSFNTTGGDPLDAELKAAVELTIATKGGPTYRARLREMLPEIRQRMGGEGWIAVRALPFLDADFHKAFEEGVRAYQTRLDRELAGNPFEVPIREGGWGGSESVAAFATRMYFLHEAFPAIVGPEYTLRGVNYLLGTHPVSSTSLVSTVGTQSKLIAYGNNRADYTFIPGGMVPGVVILKPDFPEFEEDWPFRWGESEYVISAATQFLLAANAADELVKATARQ